MPEEMNFEYSKHLFVSEYYSAVIVIPHVVIARWSNSGNTLGVYFSQSPHIELNEEEGKKFLQALYKYYRGIRQV